MGLDMYLTKKVYIGAYYEHRKVEGVIDITAEGKKINIDLSKVSEIIIQVAQWRKANAIHSWFVRECQDGVDKCQETWVPFKKLMELKSICEEVLESLINGEKKVEKKEDYFTKKLFDFTTYLSVDKVAKLLPPAEGFFFGNTDIDDWYIQDLEYTIEMLDSANSGDDIYYQSSW